MVKSCRPKSELAEIAATSASARGADLRVHFKNTYETAAAIRGRNLLEAKKYLEAVLEHKRCIPYRKYNGGIGRTAQAKEFKLSQGRWPEKSVRHLLDLIKNVEANAAVKSLDVQNLYIWHIAVQRAQKGRRRTYRAHGRINPYMSNPCHIELICKPQAAQVPKPQGDGEHKTVRLSAKQNAARKLRVDA
eukprot:Gregarina_sp_Pseudo_9__2843@NODE_3072_length_761_cov_286_106648_g2802_i0_p1_GENE_NODE_3072_length_761_cov_286_106648_g2802_i0NODE_3072_length_761_cov_286_106648_g2802_i0_p1_ORF_typecomplete_len190_score24_55Ribosomal_L22/PF00237_19/9_7e34NRBF2_MIT/PF17169_4/32NRBF2_MIT/PF17169_4/10_NODE_3072_length_761_cov_286_106648_g2802_i064633